MSHEFRPVSSKVGRRAPFDLFDQAAVTALATVAATLHSAEQEQPLSSTAAHVSLLVEFSFISLRNNTEHLQPTEVC